MHETNQGLFPPFIAAKKTRIPPNLQIIVARMNCFTDWDLRKCYLKSVTDNVSNVIQEDWKIVSPPIYQYARSKGIPQRKKMCDAFSLAKNIYV